MLGYRAPVEVLGPFSELLYRWQKKGKTDVFRTECVILASEGRSIRKDGDYPLPQPLIYAATNQINYTS